MNTPLVTVVIPARNEERDIEDCLSSIAAQDYPHECMEVLVVDGASSDATSDVAQRALRSAAYRRAAVLSNPRGSTPSSLNVGLAAAAGDILCRVDARSRVPGGYVRRCVEVLTERPEVMVVGGAQVARAPGGSGVVARGIARALRNRFSTGMARYRRMASSGASDTVYLGAFRTDELRRAGGWNERFATNQDFELNRRLGQRGLVWFERGIDVDYVPRPSLALLARQFRRFGRWKCAAWLETSMRPTPRQVAMVALPGVLVAALPLAMRRAPFATGAVLVGCAVALDATNPDPAGLGERAASIGAIAISTGSWWFGVVEQAGRRALGGRLIGGAEPNASEVRS